METERGVVGAEGWGRGGGVVSNGDKVSVLQDENVLDIDCTTL